MRSKAKGSSANSKQSDQLFFSYLIGYKISFVVDFLANQITKKQLIGLLRVGRGPLGF
jgi:hypothetical protein